jgi:DNA-binding NarL/FixJ family response regulator
MQARRGAGISVLLADDHTVVRDGLSCILSSHGDIRVVGAVGDGSDAVREAAQLSPQVVLMDISMPGLNGIEATRAILRKAPQIGVIVLSVHSSPLMVRRALDAGARGYVAKEAAAAEVVTAVREVAAGGRYLSEALEKQLPAIERAAARGGGAEQLTSVEVEILRLVAEGKSNPQVAAILGLSPRTVETYRLRLMRKLEVDDLPALVKYAIRQGITKLE